MEHELNAGQRDLRSPGLSTDPEHPEPTTYHGIAADGWWVGMGGGTECDAITFRIGTSSATQRHWTTWRRSGSDPGWEFNDQIDVPADLRQVRTLYVSATVTPEGKNGVFCLKYEDKGVRHWDFDASEDATCDRVNDSDDDVCSDVWALGSMTQA